MKLLKLLITIVLFYPYMQAQDSVKISGMQEILMAASWQRCGASER